MAAFDSATAVADAAVHGTHYWRWRWSLQASNQPKKNDEVEAAKTRAAAELCMSIQALHIHNYLHTYTNVHLCICKPQMSTESLSILAFCCFRQSNLIK